MLNIEIKIYLWSFVNYHHPYNISTTVTSHWTAILSAKSKSGVTLSENATNSIKSPYFTLSLFWPFWIFVYDSNGYVPTVSMIMSFKVFSLWQNKFLFSCLKEMWIFFFFFFFRNLDSRNSRLDRQRVAILIKKCWVL